MSKANDGYTFTAVFRKERDGGYSVYFPQLDGCFTQGNTLSEAKSMAVDALRLHLQGMIADGEDIPPDESVNPSSYHGTAIYKISVMLS